MKRLLHARGTTVLDRCLVMGIVNRTPDSFYDGGRMSFEAALGHGLDLVEEGADLLDVGAVKAGPGEDVPEDEEERRLLPLVAALAERCGVPLSVETARPAVARRAVEAGAAIVNDVSGLSDPGMARTLGEIGAGLVIVHHGGQIRGRPRHPRYGDVVTDVIETWTSSIEVATAAGVSRDGIVLDAALDFGKTTFQSLELVRRLPEQLEVGFPVLVAPSRKDVVGETLGLDTTERLEGTLALVSLAAYLGVHVVRVHDVRAAVRCVGMIEAVKGLSPPAAPLRGLWD